MIPQSEHEIFRRRRGRNFALGGALLGFALLVFAVTMVKLTEGHMMQAF